MTMGALSRKQRKFDLNVEYAFLNRYRETSSRSGDTNLYGYVANDPINWVDPSGLYPDDPAYIPGAAGTGGTLSGPYNQGVVLGAAGAVTLGSAVVTGAVYGPALFNNRFLRIGEGKFPELFSKRISIGSQQGNKIELGISRDGHIDFKFGSSRFNLREGNDNSCGE